MLLMSIYVIHVLTRKNRRDTIISEDSGKSIRVKSKVPSLVLRVAIKTRNFFINVCFNSCVLFCQLKVLAKVLGRHASTTYYTRCTRGLFWTQFSVLLPGYGSIWTTNWETK